MTMHQHAADSPSLSRSRNGFWIGIMLFFLIKLAFISFGLGSKEGPRLGDDAYVYLYYSLSVNNELSNAPGPKSLKNFATSERLQAAPPERQFDAHRVLMRTGLYPRLILHWATSHLPLEKLSFYQAFWLQEVAVLLVMTIGLGTLVLALQEFRYLWLSLPIVGLALFPGQGLHFLIPSTLALSFAFIAWGAVLTGASRPLMTFLGVLGALLAHSIGVAHVALAIGLSLGMALTGLKSRRDLLWDFGAIFSGFAVFLTIASQLNIGDGTIYDFTRLGASALVENLIGLPRYYLRFLGIDPVAGILGPIGLALMLKRSSGWKFGLIPPSRSLILAGGLVAMMICTSIYIIEGYPAEVQVRFLTPLLLLGLLGVVTYLEWPRAHAANVAFWTIVLGLSITVTSFYSLRKRDTRWPEIDQAALRQAVGEVIRSDPILYLDDDFALISSFVVGGYQFPTYSPSVLALDIDAAKTTLREKPPQAAVTLMPREFRTELNFRWSLFQPARYGLDLRGGGSISLRSDQLLDTLAFEWIGDTPPVVEGASGAPCSLQTDLNLRFIAAYECLSDGPIAIRGEGILTGLRMPDQAEQVSWPWDGPLTLEYQPASRPIGAPKAFQTDFSISELLPEPVPFDFASLLGDLHVVSDGGGFVWLDSAN
ncbi:MAG: hypothetical protein ACR2O1_04510 [Boseongicola sp.]